MKKKKKRELKTANDFKLAYIVELTDPPMSLKEAKKMIPFIEEYIGEAQGWWDDFWRGGRKDGTREV